MSEIISKLNELQDKIKTFNESTAARLLKLEQNSSSSSSSKPASLSQMIESGKTLENGRTAYRLKISQNVATGVQGDNGDFSIGSDDYTATAPAGGLVLAEGFTKTPAPFNSVIFNLFNKAQTSANAITAFFDNSAYSQETDGVHELAEKKYFDAQISSGLIQLAKLGYWHTISTEALEDVPYIESIVKSILTKRLALTAEAQLFSANTASAVSLQGLQVNSLKAGTQTTAAAAIDAAAAAVYMAGNTPRAVFVSPDVFMKYAQEISTLASVNPLQPLTLARFGVPVIAINAAATPGTGYVFAVDTDLVTLFTKYAEPVAVDVSFEHGLNFTHNAATVRAETRAAVVLSSAGAVALAKVGE